MYWENSYRTMFYLIQLVTYLFLWIVSYRLFRRWTNLKRFNSILFIYFFFKLANKTNMAIRRPTVAIPFWILVSIENVINWFTQLNQAYRYTLLQRISVELRYILCVIFVKHISVVHFKTFIQWNMMLCVMCLGVGMILVFTCIIRIKPTST